ncbi:MAG TPA: DUF481 domain-containing protein [Elusimicrobiota bacterium]|nr:DUF481 domain-containing protein [Elusimicrobiota bacterium]
MKNKLRFITAAVFLSNLFSAAYGEDAPAKKWSEKAQLTYLSANGNTKSSTLGASNEFQYNWTRAALDLTAGALGSQSKEEVTAEQYFAAEKVSWKLTARNYAFERTGWDKNRFAGIANRIDASVGLGRELIKTKRNDLILELGGGYVNEQRVKAPREDFSSGRAYSKYVFAISPQSAFSQDAEYLHNFEHPDGYRVNAETALVSAVSTHMSLKASYLVKYVNQPAPTFGKTDTLTSMALIFNY